MKNAPLDPTQFTFLAGGGEMGARMRAFDWTTTSLGPPYAWPQSLRSTVSMLLPSKAQIIVFWGDDFTVLYNDAYRPVFGSKHPHVLGLPGGQAWSEIWDTQLRGLLEGVVRTGEAFSARDLLFVIERYGFGEETYFDVSYDPVRVESGTVGGVFCIVTETTARVVGAQRLALLRDLAARNASARTEREACELVIETLGTSADVAFAFAYINNEVQASTPSAHRNVNATPADLVKTFSLPVGGADRAARLVIGLNPRRRFDDDYRSFLGLVVDQLAIALSNARAYEAERRRAEALAALDRAKTAFFSNVSHEFRTPLTLLVGPLEDELKNSEELSDDRRARIETAHRNALRLLRLVNTLLDFSRLEAGRIDASYEPTDLSALTADLASAFRSAVEKAGLRLVVDCPALPQPVYVDRDMWEKIVLNLLSNAFKFTFAGEIRVTLRWCGEHVELQVADSGVGIPAADVDRVFQRFHRVKNARSRTHEGTGIGLALVQELARLHGGGVSVTSVEGHGTTFVVTVRTGRAHLPSERISSPRSLPATMLGAIPFVEEALRWLPDDGSAAHVEAIDSDAVNAAGNDATPRPYVLIADDNADMRGYLARILRPHYQVDLVADGGAALERIRARMPDLLLTDVMMPTLDGFGLVEAIRGDERTRPLPVILLSARAGEEARIEGLQAGADEYLLKPFSARELLASVASQIRLSHARAESLRLIKENATVTETLNAALKDANRLKDEFLASLSHELRTPLNAILGYSRMLRDGLIPAPKVTRTIETIERNATSLNQIVGDVLDVSRIIAGKVRLDVQAVELPAVVENAIEAVMPAADARGVRLESIIDRGASPISGDPERLQQVVWNLLSNAVKFTNRGGKVRVRLERVDAHVELTVSDTGIGIAPEFLPHVFERFRQADSTMTRQRTGLGLGLAIARHLTEMHGGTIDVSSDGLDQGTSFRVTIPLISAFQAIEDAHITSPSASVRLDAVMPSLHGVHVLGVDDEPDALAMLADVLETAGARVSTAASAEEALAKLEADVPDVLVADLGMPATDGYALIEEIRRRRGHRMHDLPAAALTAYARAMDRTKALQAGFHIHLSKPIDPAELVTTVAALARRFDRRPEENQ